MEDESARQTATHLETTSFEVHRRDARPPGAGAPALPRPVQPNRVGSRPMLRPPRPGSTRAPGLRGGPWQLTALGGVRLALGVTELVAPGLIVDWLGSAHSSRTRRRARQAVRAIGLGTAMAGLGAMAQPRASRWARQLGDVLDLALLAGVISSALIPRRRFPSRGNGALGMVALASLTAFDVAAHRGVRRTADGVAARPGRRRRDPSPATTMTAAITIDREPAEVYAFWRDFNNLPRFMTLLRSVEIIDRFTSHWIARFPLDQVVEWDASVVADREGELIAWRSLPGVALRHSGQVTFNPAPGDRGTEVRVELELRDLRAKIADSIVRRWRKLPELHVAGDLRRLKQLLETGHVMRSDASVHAGPHPARPTLTAPPAPAPGARHT